MGNLREVIKRKGLSFLKGKELENIENGQKAYIHENCINAEINSYKNETFEKQSKIQRFYGGDTPKSERVKWIYLTQYKLSKTI
jgi:hypothetical protein